MLIFFYMVIILKQIKWRKILNKFLKRLEYISRNFSQEISGNFFREISELTTIIIILHPSRYMHWCTASAGRNASCSRCRLLHDTVQLPWTSVTRPRQIQVDIWVLTQDCRFTLWIYLIFCSCTVIIVNQWFDKNMSFWNFWLTQFTDASSCMAGSCQWLWLISLILQLFNSFFVLVLSVIAILL